MSTTIVPNYAQRGPASVFEPIKDYIQKHLDETQDLFERLKGDEDKAEIIATANYYEGCAWGIEGTLQFLTGVWLEFDKDGELVVTPVEEEA